MPELPEVESVVQDIRPFVVGKKISSLQVEVPRLIKTDEKEFLSVLPGKKIERVERRGKYILIFLEEEWVLVVHLRMTGGLVYLADSSQIEKYQRVTFFFEDESALTYVDTRTLGTLELIPEDQLSTWKGLATLGKEPLDSSLTVKDLEKSFKNRKGSIKGALLDQTVIAGLGNIYVDEVLFRSGVHPERPALSLKKKEILKIRTEVEKVISEAIHNGGTTFRDYRNGKGEAGKNQFYLKVYGRDKKECENCRGIIQKIRVVGRGTHFCAQCQK